jgi:hypothetical protein
MKRSLGTIAVGMLIASLVLAAAQASAITPGGQQQLRNLSGKVLSQHDDPLGKAIVYLKNTKTLAVKTYISDADGTYRFPALSTSVDYEIYAELNGQRSDTKTVSAFDNRKAVTLTLRIKTDK